MTLDERFYDVIEEFLFEIETNEIVNKIECGLNRVVISEIKRGRLHPTTTAKIKRPITSNIVIELSHLKKSDRKRLGI